MRLKTGVIVGRNGVHGGRTQGLHATAGGISVSAAIAEPAPVASGVVFRRRVPPRRKNLLQDSRIAMPTAPAAVRAKLPSPQ